MDQFISKQAELTQEIEDICFEFRIPGQLVEIETISAGNINNTYRVVYRDNGVATSYIVQKINKYVFKNPRHIMHNIQLISEHLRSKLPDPDDKRAWLHFCTTRNGSNFLIAGDGFWRAYYCIEDAIAYDASDDPEVLRAAGIAFGDFQRNLSDFDASLLYETIPDFHNTQKRLQTLFRHTQEDPVARVQEVLPELDYIKSVSELASHLCALRDRGAIPLRVTHNDTKTNNVLLDEATNRPLTVIDLDTVMPGLAMHDFGDAVRFAANTAVEDEPDESKVSLNLDLYRAFAEGFISRTAASLTPLELDTMALGALTITIELAVRFLDDYITGDLYFKTIYPEHNLIRTRCQLALARDMQKKFPDMEQIIREIRHA